MISTFYMPTRIVAGAGSLATIGRLARDLGMSRALVVTDPVISAQPFHAEALAALDEAGIGTARFDECGIDARCSHIDAQGERVRRDGIDGVVCIGGGPLSFPDAAILDAVTLRSLPKRVAAPPAVNALTHAVEAYLSGFCSPLTDAIALGAVKLQYGSLRASINSDDERARGDNLIASCMANVACGNARLGHGHALSLPPEGHLDLPHPYGVGVLLPEVTAFNFAALPAKVKPLAEALEIDMLGPRPRRDHRGLRRRDPRPLHRHSFPTRFTPEQLRHDPGLPFQVKGPEGVKHLADVLHPGIPDMALPIEDAVAEGEKVLIRLRVVGTHGGDLMGLPATGKPIDIGVMDLFHVRDGVQVEHWALLDNLGLLKQLGA